MPPRVRSSSLVRLASPRHPRRTAPFHQEPGFYEPAGLWLYGNVWLLDSALASVSAARFRSDHRPRELEDIEREAEKTVLESQVLVCGIHSPAHRRTAIVPLRWGSPRIVVFSGGFRYHLGRDLKEEPFDVARLWRDGWDPKTDLAVSRRAPDARPTYASVNPPVDRLIERIVQRDFNGALFNSFFFGPESWDRRSRSIEQIL